MNFNSFSVSSQCENNGGCAQLCVLKSGNSRRCMCNAGLVPAEDGVTCKSVCVIVFDYDRGTTSHQLYGFWFKW